MPDTSDNKIEFIQYHQPGVLDGTYTITMEQVVTVDGLAVAGSPFRLSKRLAVRGARFRLQPQDVHSLFPPAGSLGDHANTLPHIILNRSTLPWERLAWPLQAGDTDAEKVAKRAIPWLALLLFDQDEVPTPQVITLAALQQSA